jgi:hypothetical protein
MKAAKFNMETVKGTPVLKTVRGTAVLKGTPTLVKTKFGAYYVFPEAAASGELLVQVNMRHKVFDEFEVRDGSNAVVYRQTKTLPGKELKKGDWHVDFKAVAV